MTFLNGVAEALTGWPQAEAVGPAAAGRLPHRQRADPPAGREPRPPRPAGGDGRRAGEPHGPHRPGRDRAADRRQRRPDPGRGRGPGRGGPGLPRRHRAQAGRGGARRGWRPSSSRPRTRSSARRSTASSASWNAGAERLFGYTAAGGHRPADHPDHPAGAADEERRSGGSAAGSGRALRDVRWPRTAAARHLPDVSPSATRRAVIGASKIARDITERKRASGAAGERAALRTLADNLPSASSTNRPRGRRLPPLQLRQRRRGGALRGDAGGGGRGPGEPLRAHRGGGPASRAGRGGRGLPGPEAVRLPVPVQARDGQVRWLHCRSAPRDLAGGSAVWDGIAMDITERVADGGGAAGGRPEEGRVHRAAGPRAAEPAGPAPQRPAGDAAGGRRRRTPSPRPAT